MALCKNRLLSILLILWNQILPLHSFASWYMANCLIDLWDEHEVIMGHRVVPPIPRTLDSAVAGGDDDHQALVSIQVLDFETQQEIIPVVVVPTMEAASNNQIEDRERVEHYKDNISARSVIPLPPLLDEPSSSQGAEDVRHKYLIQLNLSSQAKCSNFQYVLDAKPMTSNRKSSSSVASTTVAASPRFLSQRNGCKGQRAYGTFRPRGGDNDEMDRFLLEVTISFSNEKGINEERMVEEEMLMGKDYVHDGGDETISHDNSVLGIQLVAGWACGKEAVKRTEPIYFMHLKDDGNDENDVNKKVHNQEL